MRLVCIANFAMVEFHWSRVNPVFDFVERRIMAMAMQFRS